MNEVHTDNKETLYNALNRIEELENKIADTKANCDLAIEGRDVKIMEVESENNKLLDVINNQDVKIADLEKQIEQMQDAKCISCTDLGGMMLKITDLEKKNAELKALIKSEHEIEARKNNRLISKLTKAKEFIRWFVVYEKGEGIITNYNNFLEQAEQFLKEIEKCQSQKQH